MGEMHIHSFQIPTFVKVRLIGSAPPRGGDDFWPRLFHWRWSWSSSRGRTSTTGWAGTSMLVPSGIILPFASVVSQVEKGPFFTGDSSNKKKLAPLDTSAGVRGV